MKPPITVNRPSQKITLLSTGLAIALLAIAHPSYSQCTAAPIAAAACSGGNGAASNGMNISSGTYWVSGNATFSSITLSGGTLRICGNLTVTSFGFSGSGGTLIVESGGSLTVTTFGSINGGVTIINRGSIISSGGLTVQNTNHIYNEQSGTMTISGTVTFPSSSTTVVNRGNMSFSSLSYSAGTGSFCLQAASLTTIYAFDNESTDAFTYSGTGFAACLNVTGSATLGHDVTTSALIHVCKGGSTTVSGGATSNPGGGWGSATVYNNCNSCATVLALNFLSLTAEQQSNGILLQWKVDEDNRGGEVFYVERSSNGYDYRTISTIESMVGQASYTALDADLADPVEYYRIRAVLPTGAVSYSSVTSIATGSTGQLTIYPNPIRADKSFNIILPSTATGTAQLSVIDLTGKIVRTKNAALIQGNNQLSWELGNISAGIYMVRVDLPGKNILYSRIAVL